MAKQTDGRRWRFRAIFRPKVALLLVGVWFDNLFAVLYKFVTVGQTVNSAIFLSNF